MKYTYDDANNIITRNDNSYVYDKVNRLQQATIRGYFEDNFTKADMLIGKVDQDYHGEKEQEEDVTAQTQIKMDYDARSLIFNLKFDAENICRVELVPEITSHRVPTDQLDIYYRNGVGFTKLDKSSWTGTKDDTGKITIRFTPVLATSEIKIHCNYDDLDYLQLPIDRSEFYNTPEKLVTVYQKFVARTETYGYDGMGNRTSEKVLLRKEYGYTYTYYPNSNRLKSKEKDDGSEKIEYAYDENGNLTSKVVTKGSTVDTWEYSYDLLNQLEQVKKNGVIVSSYIYNPTGFRVEKNGSKGRIDYVPLLNGEVGYRKEFSSGKEYSFIYVGGQHLARVNGVIGGDGKKFFYQNDHLGTALAITDEYGNKVIERDFTPFGERLKQSENDGVAADEDDSAFTGKDWDIDAGLYYYNARWYDPEIGRFTSEDSVADPNNPNEYAYCYDNPVNNIDPTGHFSMGDLGTIATVISAAAIITGDENLGALAGAMGLFISVKSLVQYIEIHKALDDLIKAGQAAPDPVEEADSSSDFTASENQSSTDSETEGTEIQVQSSTEEGGDTDKAGTQESENTNQIEINLVELEALAAQGVIDKELVVQLSDIIKASYTTSNNNQNNYKVVLKLVNASGQIISGTFNVVTGTIVLAGDPTKLSAALATGRIAYGGYKIVKGVRTFILEIKEIVGDKSSGSSLYGFGGGGSGGGWGAEYEAKMAQKMELFKWGFEGIMDAANNGRISQDDAWSSVVIWSKFLNDVFDFSNEGYLQDALYDASTPKI